MVFFDETGKFASDKPKKIEYNSVGSFGNRIYIIGGKCMKKLLALLLCFAMVFSLFACEKGNDEPEGKDEDEEILTKYTAVYVEIEDSSFRAEELFSGDTYIRLKEENEGKLMLDGESISFKWKLKGEDLTITTEDDDEYEGTLEDGIITIEIDGATLTLATKDTKVREPKNLVSGGVVGPDGPEGPMPTVPAAGVSVAGWYDGYYVESVEDNASFRCEDLFSDTPCVSLSDDFTGYMMLEDEYAELTYTLDYPSITIYTDDGDEISGTVENGILVLTDDGVRITFATYDAEVPVPDNLTDLSNFNTGSNASADYWNGDWYGWWIMENRTGYYAELDVDWWDAAARVTVDETNNGVLYFWDEDQSYSDPIATVYFTLGEGTTDAGCLTSESGNFWDLSIGHADWIVDPGACSTSDFDHMITIDGHYEDSNGSFDYYIYLRPWGMLWDDIAEANADLLPYYYAWYQEMVAAGEGMPDSFESAS